MFENVFSYEEQDAERKDFKNILINSRLQQMLAMANYMATKPKPIKGCQHWIEIQKLEPAPEPRKRWDAERRVHLTPLNFSLPKYFSPKIKIKKKKFVHINAAVTNNMLKLRTGTYPLMPKLKHYYDNTNLNLSDDCYFCPQSRETLSHILYHCPKYNSIRRSLVIPHVDDQTDPQTLQDANLCNIKNMKSFNMLVIHKFLSERWAFLAPFLPTSNGSRAYARRNQKSSRRQVVLAHVALPPAPIIGGSAR